MIPPGDEPSWQRILVDYRFVVFAIIIVIVIGYSLTKYRPDALARSGSVVSARDNR
jgi:hypothetical protein